MSPFFWIDYLLADKQKRLRIKHVTGGHPFEKTVELESHTFEKHPHSCIDMVYMVNVRFCCECQLAYLDNGLEFRDKD